MLVLTEEGRCFGVVLLVIGSGSLKVCDGVAINAPAGARVIHTDVLAGHTATLHPLARVFADLQIETENP